MSWASLCRRRVPPATRPDGPAVRVPHRVRRDGVPYSHTGGWSSRHSRETVRGGEWWLRRTALLGRFGHALALYHDEVAGAGEAAQSLVTRARYSEAAGLRAGGSMFGSGGVLRGYSRRDGGDVGGEAGAVQGEEIEFGRRDGGCETTTIASESLMRL